MTAHFEGIGHLQTPAYLVDEALLVKNLKILHDIEEQADCKILLAQKAFSMFATYPLIGQYLSGTTASGLFEAKLGFEEMGKENHIFSPAYQEKDFAEILAICDHLVFNSFAQWQQFKDQALKAGRSCGIRINPECSTQEHGIYDPCSPGSRMGVTLKNFKAEQLEGIEGLHFHTLCEQNVDDLIKTWAAVEEKFGKFLPQMKWLNLGGGHHITRDDYDREVLIGLVKGIKEKYGVAVYLEPGEAVALNAGFLVTSIVDIVDNGIQIAILDASAACHMPDVIEMPYRPEIVGAGKPGEKAYSYQLAGPTCLAGDVIGDYSFDEALAIGDKLVFCDMAIYSMVKNNTFNGMPLPDIVLRTLNGEIKIVKRFGYDDFKMRLS
jgi:carboxynorspermidine decarboxylase